MIGRRPSPPAAGEAYLVSDVGGWQRRPSRIAHAPGFAPAVQRDRVIGLVRSHSAANPREENSWKVRSVYRTFLGSRNRRRYRALSSAFDFSDFAEPPDSR